MTQRIYKMEVDDMHYRFQHSRKKVQMIGGGFGNGKTTAGVVKALQLARDYPGSNGLIARATYPKLNDTTRKEFLNWCPPSWIKHKNLSTENTVILQNGTTVNFRYIQQSGKNNESSTSNLLSATYDWILVDQIEDPEITEKDFLDLFGRLRGSTPYTGDDPTMPASGPRWIMILCNPTRNWVYRKLVKPVHDLKNGIKNEDLIVDPDTGELAIDLFESSTYDNKSNLPADFISGMEMLYRGQMRSRFLEGQWGAYEGLVYPEYNQSIHYIDHEIMLAYYDQIRAVGGYANIIEAYDHGIASPACYGLGFTDFAGNVFLLDGFYERELTITEIADGIKQRRSIYEIQDIEEELRVLADPAIFKRTTGNSTSVGITVSGLLREQGIHCIRANNDIISGIAKVQSYLAIDKDHLHPINGTYGSPRLFISKNCEWFDHEIADYYWKKNNITGAYEDQPMDRNDHAMDMIKYLLTHRPRIAKKLLPKPVVPVKYLAWQERSVSQASNSRIHRYAAR